MKTRFRRQLTVGAGIAALALAGSTAAFAASPSTVSVAGSTTAGSHAYNANSTAAISFVAGASMSCTSVSATGNLNSGSVAWAPPDTGGLGTITGSTWNGCTGAGFNLDVAQVGTWKVDITGDTVSGVTPIEVSSIDATVKDHATGGGLCSFAVTGTAPGSVSNSAQTLTINATNLTVTPSPTCGGLVHGPASFNGTFAITNPSTGLAFPVNIS